MLNQWLCVLFQASPGLAQGFAMDSMQTAKKNAPPKWVRVGTWVIAQIIGTLHVVLGASRHTGISILAWIMSLSAAVISFRFFYKTSFWRQLSLTLILILAAVSAELFAGAVRWIFHFPPLSIDYTQADMMFASLIGSFFSYITLFLVASLWRRFNLQKRMPRGSWAFVLMPLCLFIPTTIYCIEIVRNNGSFSPLHIISMSGAFILNFLLICVQFNQAEKDETEKELAALKRQAELERQRYESLEARQEEMAKIRHDYNNHLSSVLGLLQMERSDEAVKTVKDLLAKMEITGNVPKE